MRAADMMWAKGMDYHHGQLAACEGIFCPTPNPPVPQYIFAHTCAHIRFEYAADSRLDGLGAPTRPRSTRLGSRATT